MNGLRIFDHPKFGKIRVISDNTNGELLFCANDITNALGYTNGRKAVSDHVEDPDVTQRYIGVVTGKKADGSDAVQTVNTTFVTESGMYALIFGSKLGKAREFKHWVTSDVLPSIRKTGSYSINEPTLQQKIQAKIAFADWSAKFLNLNDASKLGIAQRIGKEVGLDEALPKVINAGTDHPTLHSAKDLLKEHGITTSVQVFNKVLEAKGIVKTATRPGKAGKTHSWKVLQPAYDKYGQNVQDPKFQNQTQIKWYDNLFGELLFSVGVKKELAFNM